ncbi:MAG: hypothetical protein MUF54_01405, partial [Polyangiaceae bacterium]|nr:hypothetical protein [Polyangiaceae bacterium]
TFCFGPLNCRRYRAGPTRTVPGRKGMVYEEEDWVDQGCDRASRGRRVALHGRLSAAFPHVHAT